MTSEVITVSLVHFEQFEKSILVTFEVLKKLDPKTREVRALQLLNMSDMLVTAEVSKLGSKIREVNL